MSRSSTSTRPSFVGSTIPRNGGHARARRRQTSRQGGLTKFYATEEFCEDSNGNPGIQTSNNNVALAWDQEECRAWVVR